MKTKLILAAAAAMLLTACSPEIYRVFLEVRQPSSSGLSLAGKSIAMVYMDGPTKADSTLSATTAAVLAEALEKDYFNSEEVIGTYSYPVADSVSVEVMRSLVMDTGEDVVFLIRSCMGEPENGKNGPNGRATHPDSSYVYTCQVPVNMKLFVYDSLDKDEVKSYKGDTSVKVAVFNNGIIPDENLGDLARSRVPGAAGAPFGSKISSRFLSSWKTESFAFYWFDDFNSEKWFSAIDKIEKAQFTDAIKIWEPFLKSGNQLKAAHACYNIALTFYLLGDMNLASKWLDEADKLENVSQLPYLRKRIASSLEK